VEPQRLIGVDLGGTAIKLGAVLAGPDAAPRILARDRIEGHGDRDPKPVIEDLLRRIRSLIEEAGWSGDDAVPVGIGSAGLIERETGRIAFSPNLPGWSGTELGRELKEGLGRPVRVDNDVNAFALAEWTWGAGKQAANAIFLTVGTGIGGAWIVDGRLVRGSRGFAGEPGHATLVLDGIPCPCGNRGCAERYVGKEALVAAARRHPEFARVARLTDLDPLTPEGLYEAAGAGSAVAEAVFLEAGRALGALLVGLVNIANPERVIVGGGIAQSGDLLLGPARRHLERHSLVARYAPPEVIPADLGEEAGLLGAAALGLAAPDEPRS
jgi:glucokinase